MGADATRHGHHDFVGLGHATRSVILQNAGGILERSTDIAIEIVALSGHCCRNNPFLQLSAFLDGPARLLEAGL